MSLSAEEIRGLVWYHTGCSDKSAKNAAAEIWSALEDARSQARPEEWRPNADAMARAICAERCAACGDPPCWSLDDVEWDGGKCDDQRDCDCASLVRVALAASDTASAAPSEDG